MLNVDFSERCRKFISSVCNVLRHKETGYEDVFSEILIRKCLPVLDYELDCVFLDTSSFNVVSKAWNSVFRWLFSHKGSTQPDCYFYNVILCQQNIY